MRWSKRCKLDIMGDIDDLRDVFESIVGEQPNFNGLTWMSWLWMNREFADTCVQKIVSLAEDDYRDEIYPADSLYAYHQSWHLKIMEHDVELTLAEYRPGVRG